MKIKSNILWSLVLILFVVSCKPKFNSPLDSSTDYSKGAKVDYSVYISIGDSLTAGYMDGTVYKSGQKHSFPMQLANLLIDYAGTNAFTQPSFSDDTNDVGGMLFNGTAVTGSRLFISVSKQLPSPSNLPITADLKNAVNTVPHNLGIPGAKSFHLLASGYGSPAGIALGTANLFYVRHASSASASVIGDAMSLKPTFFTLWIGANDVLAYALSGGTGKNQTDPTVQPTSYGPNDITNPTIFKTTYQNILNTLTSSGAKGVVCTIPDVSSIPNFTRTPYNPLPASKFNGANITAANTAYTAYNNGLVAAKTAGLIDDAEETKRKIVFTDGQDNPVVIIDESLKDLSSLNLPSIRQTTSEDYILLAYSGLIGQPVSSTMSTIWGVSQPFEDKHILTASEVKEVRDAVDDYNKYIKLLADDKGLPVADMHAKLKDLSSTGLRSPNGQLYFGNFFSLETANSTVFSLDGVHPNAKGYALVTNILLDVLEAKYGTKLPYISPGTLPGTGYTD